DLSDVIVGDRIPLELAHACARFHEIEQDVVVTGKIGLIHRSSRLKTCAEGRFTHSVVRKPNLTPFHGTINRCGLGTSSRSISCGCDPHHRMLGEGCRAHCRCRRRSTTSNSAFALAANANSSSVSAMMSSTLCASMARISMKPRP